MRGRGRTTANDVGARVLFVTGKGGTGKSSVAAALAREAARRGRLVLLVRMPTPAEPDEQRPRGGKPAPARRLPDVPLLRERILDDRRDLEAFLTRVLGLGMVARRLGESRTFSAVAAAAPGLRDLVALCAITAEATQQRGLVVVDAPASGHSVPMLTAPSRVLERAPLGPVAREAARTMAFLADRRAFAAVLVTTPEELAITEVVSLHDEVVTAGVATVRVVVNAVWPAYVSIADGDAIAASGASSDAEMHWRRYRRQAELLEELDLRMGACPRIGFDFGDGEPPDADIAALLDTLPGGSA